MKQTLEQMQSGKLKLVEETLTDGSKVYNVTVNNSVIACTSRYDANTLFDLLSNTAYDILPETQEPASHTLTLKEAITHAENIKTLDCKICGRTMSILGDKIELIAAIRNNGYCSSCQNVMNYVETHSGKLPTYEELMK